MQPFFRKGDLKQKPQKSKNHSQQYLLVDWWSALLKSRHLKVTKTWLWAPPFCAWEAVSLHGWQKCLNVTCQPFFLALIGHEQTKMAAPWKAWRQAGEVFVLQLAWYWWSNLALHLCLGYPLTWSAFWHLHWRLLVLAFMDSCQKSRPNRGSLSSACKSLSLTGSWAWAWQAHECTCCWPAGSWKVTWRKCKSWSHCWWPAGHGSLLCKN